MIDRLDLVWLRQGEVRWQQNWIDQYGHTRTHIPNLEEHISFANFDLRRAGLPTIQGNAGSALYIEYDIYRVSGFPPNAGIAFCYGKSVSVLLKAVRPHGFEASDPKLKAR